MKVHCDEVVANHIGPEPCAGLREGVGEASVDYTIRAWIMRKYRRLSGHKVRASMLMQRIAKQNPSLFAHWRFGGIGAFV